MAYLPDDTAKSIPKFSQPHMTFFKPAIIPDG
jgi:hypothetical protein